MFTKTVQRLQNVKIINISSHVIGLLPFLMSKT